ncbi:MAG: SGNH/GDSL hydrolase family protein [Myxococcales bacterium]
MLVGSSPSKNVTRWVLSLGFALLLNNCSSAGPADPAPTAAGSAGVTSVSGSAGSVNGGVAASGGSSSVGSGGAGGSTGVAQGGQSPAGQGGEATQGGQGGLAGKGGQAASGGQEQGGAAGSFGQSGQGGVGGGTSTFRPCPTDGTPCKIMPFGDSITDGYNADTPGGYRIELFRLAHAAGKNITFVGSGQNGPSMVDGVQFPQNHEGHSGWTIAPAGGRSGISTLVASVMPQYKPQIVLLMIGTNDAIDNYQMAAAPDRLGQLIDSIYAHLPNVLIIVAQPIPSREDAGKGDDTTLSARIKAFCNAIPALVKARADAGKHILVVDMNTPFAPKATLLEDQWHPNTAGYALLAKQWYASLQPLL